MIHRRGEILEYKYVLFSEEEKSSNTLMLHEFAAADLFLNHTADSLDIILLKNENMAKSIEEFSR